MSFAFGAARETDLSREAELVGTACPSPESDGMSHRGATHRQCGSLAAVL